jgi:hypothetical protein
MHKLRYKGPFEVGMILTCPDNDGELGFRRIRLLAPYPDSDMWIYEDLPSRLQHSSGHVGKLPELNLRIVFEPE